MADFGRGLERWLYKTVHGKEAPRGPRRKSRRGPSRNYKYRAWVASLPSAVSGQLGCEACHTVNNGMRSKGSDYSCVPLTREEHREYDAGKEEFEAKHGISMRDLVRDLNRMWFKYSDEVK